MKILILDYCTCADGQNSERYLARHILRLPVFMYKRNEKENVTFTEILLSALLRDRTKRQLEIPFNCAYYSTIL